MTSERVQLSKSRSLLSSKVVVVSFRLTCLVASTVIGISSSTVEVIASPLIGPMGVGVHWVLRVWISSTTWIVATVCRNALNSIFFLLFSSPSLFKFSYHPNVFINLNLNSVHRSDLPLLKRRSSNFKQFYYRSGY